MKLSELNSEIEEQIHEAMSDITGPDIDESDFFDLCDSASNVLTFAVNSLARPGEGRDPLEREKRIKDVQEILKSPDNLKHYLKSAMRTFLAEKFGESKKDALDELIDGSVDEYFASSE